MKISKFIPAFCLIGALAFFSCNIIPNDPEGPGRRTDDTTTVTPSDTATTIDYSALGDLPTGCLTVAEAIEKGKALSGTDTTEFVYIRGYVKKIASKHEDGVKQYGNGSFYMVDAPADSEDFYAFQVYYLDGKKFTDPAQVAVGDLVVLYCRIINYNGTIESAGKGTGYIYKTTNNFVPTVVQVDNDGTEQKPFTPSEVIALNNTKSGTYFVKGYIVGQVNGKNMSGAELAAPFTGNDSGVGTNLLLATAADETNTANMVPIQLPASMREFSLPAVPENLGKELLVYGSLEAYFGQPGVKNLEYALFNSKEYGVKPDPSKTEGAMLNETLLSQESFNKFTVVSIIGDLTWTFDSKYGAKMSGYADGKTNENEDWFISPAIDLTGKDAKLSFEHARGPASSMSIATEGHYTLWVSNDFEGNDAQAVQSATWTELTIPTHGTTGWGFVNSGEIAVPAANRAANCRFAWKYVCDNKESATWEINNVIVK